MANQLQELLKKHAEKFRFAVVGGANTVLDFAILFLLTNLGLDKIVSNYISSTIAFVFSFFVNKSFTFKSKGGDVKKQFARFIIVTITGLWVLQPLVILGVTSLMSPLNYPENVNLFVAKLIATLVTLVWNYIFYSKFVFKTK